MEQIKKYIHNYPGLYLYLLSDIETPSDYEAGAQAEWGKSLYRVLREEYSAVSSTLEEPLKSLIAQVNLNSRAIELERTMLNIMCLEAVLNDDYAFFEQAGVPSDNVITQDQFYYWQDLVKSYFPDDKIKFLHAELIINDFGKVKPLRLAMMEEFGITARDPDDFICELLQLPHEQLSAIFPGLRQFDASEYKEFQEIKKGFHFGHFAHGESTANQLSPIKELFEANHIDQFYQNFVAHLFDLSGVLAHVNGKILLNDVVFEMYTDYIMNSLDLLCHVPVKVAYQNYLVQRAKHVGYSYSNRDEMSWSELFSLRLLCMQRIYHHDKAEQLFNALDELWQSSSFTAACEAIVKYQEKENKTPTYMPTVFKVLYDKYVNEVNPYMLSVQQGIKLISSGLTMHQQLIDSGLSDTHNPVNFNSLAQSIKEQPDVLKMIQSHEDLVIRRSDYHIRPKADPAVARHPQGYIGL